MSADIETLLYELKALPDPCPHTHVLALLRSFAGHRLYLSKGVLVRPEQVRVALLMLKSGMSRPEVARALQERLGVSEKTAYRIISRSISRRPPEQADLFR